LYDKGKKKYKGGVLCQKQNFQENQETGEKMIQGMCRPSNIQRRPIVTGRCRHQAAATCVTNNGGDEIMKENERINGYQTKIFRNKSKEQFFMARRFVNKTNGCPARNAKHQR
jgi:hypothetical protein